MDILAPHIVKITVGVSGFTSARSESQKATEASPFVPSCTAATKRSMNIGKEVPKEGRAWPGIINSH